MKKRKNIITVAIDSPAAAGAGTQAKLIAKHYNLQHLDTGRIYRLIGKLKLENPKKFSLALVKKKIERTYERIMKYFPVLAMIFILVAVLVIYNTVKLSIFARKDLVQSLKLIGATKLFIQMPFIFEGLIDGLLASVIASPLIILTVNGINYVMSNFTTWNIQLSIEPILFFWLTLLSGIISVLGSYRAASGIMR